jgi:hypothetical protein
VTQQIYDHLKGLDDKSTTVQFRPADKKIVLVFSDNGEIGIGVEDHMDELNDVESSGGRYYVYATGDQTDASPPPPDAMCPCGGP